MSFVIKGYCDGKPFFEKGSFKMYGFHPNDKYLDKVILSDYGNITIKGELPTMIDGKEYEIEVEYEKKGKYESYVVKRILNNPMEMNEMESYNFLSELISERLAQNILNVYPNFIKLIISNKQNEIDVKKISGLGEKKLEMVTKKIKENVCYYNVINEFKEYELTLNQVKKIHNTYSSFELLKEKMNENPYRCLCTIAGISFKTADSKILNKNKSLATSLYRMQECVLYKLSENEENGNTWMSSSELYSQCSEIVPQCIKEFKNVLQKNTDIYYDRETKRISKLQTYNYEKEISKLLLTIHYDPRVLDINYKKYDTVDNSKLTEQQMLSTEYACKYNFFVLAGFAGSGKTFSSKALINMLDDNHLSYVLFAPTGKAAKNLAQNTNKEASTIHRGLGFNPEYGFIYNENNKLPFDFVIVDEATMIDIYLMRSLLLAIDPTGTKLIFICDPAQIPSVGCGNCIQDILGTNIFPTIFLNKVFRYEDGGLAKVATDTREGERFLSDDSVQKFGDDFVFITTAKETLMNKIITAYKKMEEKGGKVDDIIVISSYNVGEFGTYNINSMIQDLVNPSTNSMEMSYVRQKFEIKFRLNDRVMQTVNNYKAQLYLGENYCSNDNEDEPKETAIFNGDDGKVVKIAKDKKGRKYMVVDFYGNLVIYKEDDIRDLLLAYSISSHRSQGSGYNYVICITPPPHKFFLNRNLLYVMYSRAKKFVYNIGTVDTIDCALNKSENLARKTHLKDLLLEANTN